MSKPPRTCYEGSVHHVTCRGDNREPIFLSDQDRQYYLMLLRRYKDRFRFKLLAYCLMPNHVHLLLQTASEGNLSQVMLCLNTVYARYFNRRYRRVGHLFQGPFDDRLIEDDGYLLVASRYIHRNPVKAELCKTPQKYAWSSYPAYCLSGSNPLELTDPELILSLVSSKSSLSEQKRSYQLLVEVYPMPADDWRPETSGTGEISERKIKRARLNLV